MFLIILSNALLLNTVKQSFTKDWSGCESLDNFHMYFCNLLLIVMLLLKLHPKNLRYLEREKIWQYMAPLALF